MSPNRPHLPTAGSLWVRSLGSGRTHPTLNGTPGSGVRHSSIASQGPAHVIRHYTHVRSGSFGRRAEALLALPLLDLLGGFASRKLLYTPTEMHLWFKGW